MLSVAGVVVALTQTIIVPLIPRLPDLLDTAPDDATWALTATLLVGAVSTPIGGRLGDTYGKWSILMVSMSMNAAGSVVCALSSSLAPFLIGRSLQGLGFCTIPLGISIVRDFVPPPYLPSAIASISAALGVGGALGLPFAAAVSAKVGWHALFWVCAAAAIVSSIGIASTVPKTPSRKRERFDWVGAIGLAVIMVCLILPLSSGAAWGWASPRTLGLLVAFALTAIGWWFVERRRAYPLLDLELVVKRPVLLTNIASITVGFAFYSMQLIPIQLLMAPTSSPDGLGLSMLTAGFVLAPGGILMFVFSNVSAHAMKSFGSRAALVVGAVVMGLGYIVLIVVLTTPYAATWEAMTLVASLSGAGLGIAYAAIPALIMNAVRVEQTGEANGVNALMRTLGTSMSAAVVGMILTSSMVSAAMPGNAVLVPRGPGYLCASVISLAACLVAAAVAIAIPKSPNRFDGSPDQKADSYESKLLHPPR